MNDSINAYMYISDAGYIGLGADYIMALHNTRSYINYTQGMLLPLATD